MWEKIIQLIKIRLKILMHIIDIDSTEDKVSASSPISSLPLSYVLSQTSYHVKQPNIALQSRMSDTLADHK